MLYRFLRELARVALHWHYGHILVLGRERIPPRGALLIVANHPNALVDALLVGTSVSRRVLLTAKATLFEHPLLAPLLSAVGVVPLRRAKDVVSSSTAVTSARNDDAFLRVTQTLLEGRVVLVFPEGISHDEPMLAPLKTGAARMAIAAAAAGVRGLRVLPVGLVFEEKERPRSRVLVRIGEPLIVDDWFAHATHDAAGLTKEIDARLRLVTLNFASSARAERAVRLASALAAISREPASLRESMELSLTVRIAQRVERATEALEHAAPSLSSAVDAFVVRLSELESRLSAHGITLEDARISPRLRHGAWFILREGLVALIAFPIAVFGRLTHWVPIWLARSFALRSLANDSSRDQPAMRTILVGILAVGAWYALQGVLLIRWLGWQVAALWLIAAFISAQVDRHVQGRLARAVQRARTYLALRRNAELRISVSTAMDALVREALDLEHALEQSVGASDLSSSRQSEL